jgi:photosystem II stability/assembly factor-like uncharacterized protein
MGKCVSRRGHQTTRLGVALAALATLALWSPACLAQQPGSREAKAKVVLGREKWFLQTRAYPNAHIPPGARLRALDQRARVAAGVQRASSAPAGSLAPAATAASTAPWTAIGPQPGSSSNPLSSGGDSGRATSAAVDPSNANTVYLGTAGGGVWKTVDAGAHWTPLTDTQASLAVGAIAIDPSNASIVYVGTGESNYSIDSYYGAGLLKSTDGGTTWTRITGPFVPASGSGTSFGSITVSPANGSLLLAGTYTGVYRSTDAGSTWTLVLANGAGYSVLFDPTSPTTAYAGLGTVFGAPANGVYKSTDSGATWTRLTGTGANVLPTQNLGRIRVVMDPSNSSTLYASIAPPAGSTAAIPGVFKSLDGGNNWSKLTTPPDCCDWYSDVFAVVPGSPNVLFAGAGSMYRSPDGGVTWNAAGGYVNPPGGANAVNLHPDQHAIAFAPNGVMYVATDGGVFSTTTPAAGTYTWNDLNATIATITFYPGLAIDPTSVTNAFAGTQDNGSLHYSGSIAWGGLAPCGDGGFAAIDSTNPLIVYVGCAAQQGLWKSADGGASFGSRLDPGQSDRADWVTPLAMDPSNAQVLYWGTYRLYESVDGAMTWTAISGDLTKGASDLATIAVAPSDSNTVWVGAEDGSVQVTSTATKGAAATWTNVSTGLPTRAVTQIAVDPHQASTAYAGFSGFGAGHVLQTTNLGSSWKDISGNLPDVPVNSVLVDPDLQNTLYVGTDVGVFVTADGGTTWAPLGTSLPNVVVNSLTLHRATRTLRAATHGRSAWDLPVPIGGFAFTASPASLTFAAQVVGTTGSPQSFQLTNRLTTAQAISSITASGDFAQTNNCGTSLAAGATCTVNVTFTPVAADARTGAIMVTAPGGSGSIPLSGTGTITLSLQASVATATVGQTVTLSWSSQSVAACTASGGAAGDQWAGAKASSGSSALTESAAGAVTYSMSCTAGSQTVQAQAPVTFTLPTVTLSANATSTTAGSAVTLTWMSSNAAACTGSGGVSGDGWSGSKALSGSASVTAAGAGTDTYVISCTAASKSTQAQASVTYTVPTVTLSASPTSTTTGSAVTLTWNSSHASACMASGGVSGDGWSGSKSLSGSLSVTESSAGTNTYVISCTAASQSAQSQATVSVSSPPSGGGGHGGGGALDPASWLTLLGALAGRLLGRRRAVRLARFCLALTLAGLVLPHEGRASDAGSAGGKTPMVLCKPCTEVPPPKGYACAGKIMVRKDVPTKRIARLEKQCKRQKERSRGA